MKANYHILCNHLYIHEHFGGHMCTGQGLVVIGLTNFKLASSLCTQGRLMTGKNCSCKDTIENVYLTQQK